MAKALYRQYRSKKLSEVVGQDHITTTLSNALKSGQISHAYLLTGPRGVGKTSIARILAHEINGLPYEDDSEHLDIIEIDAASNRRIDEIRDLREKAFLAPTSAKYKVYIIDEVHMLTREAFNALLKTLEEPPEHVIFILATTELHKLPDTIISRTQRFGFKPISVADMVAHLRSIAEKEKIVIDDEALAAISEHAGGSFRDGISLLDQARGYGKDVTVEDVENLLGRAPITEVNAVIEMSLGGQAYEALESVSKVLDGGTSAEMLAGQLMKAARAKLLNGGPADLAIFIQQLLAVPGSHNPHISLELAIFNFASRGGIEEAPKKPKPVAEASVKPEPPKSPEEEKEIPPATELGGDMAELWTAVLNDIKGHHNTLYGILRMAEMSIDKDDKLTLAFQFPFHMKRASEPRHKTVVENTFKKIGGKVYEIKFIKRTMESPKSSGRAGKSTSEAKKPQADTLDAVKDIFGGGELMN